MSRKIEDPGHNEGHVCANCGHSGEGKFCSECGQQYATLNKPMKEIFGDLVGMFNLDKSILSTFRPFLFKPGFLSREFLEGRRRKYLSPVRLYLFLSLVFFFVLNIYSSRADSAGLRVNFNTGSNLTRMELDSSAIEILQSDSLFKETIGSDSRNSRTTNFLRRSLLNSTLEREKFSTFYWRNISYAMFLLMPVFALLIGLLFLRRRRYYIEHLIFSINMHSFAIFILLIYILFLLLFPFMEDLPGILLLIIPVYFIIGMKRFYRQRTWLVILKSLTLGVLYFILITVVMTGLFFFTGANL